MRDPARKFQTEVLQIYRTVFDLRLKPFKGNSIAGQRHLQEEEEEEEEEVEEEGGWGGAAE